MNEVYCINSVAHSVSRSACILDLSMKTNRLSPTALAAHLSCSHLTQLERQRRAGDLEIDFKADPRPEALQERGRRHEAAYVIRLGNDGRTIKDLTESRNPEDTLVAM